MIYFDPVTQDSPIIDREYPATKAPVVFYNEGSKILGTIFLAAGKEPHATAILLCGFPGNESNADIAYMLRRQGFNVLTFYYRGSWGSQGIYSWKNLVNDTLAAYNFLKDKSITEQFKIDEKKIFFIGHSIGGFAALYNSIFLNDVKNICAMAPFNAGYFGKFLQVNPEIKLYSIQKMLSSMDFVNCNSPGSLLDEIIEHSDKWDLINYIDKLKEKNLLIIGAKYDITAPLEIHHNPFIDKLKTNNSKLETTVLATCHSFSDKRIQLMRLISDWTKQIKF
ncbi:MAG: hypothetical protein AABZ54_03215 [Bacteroidota bacterium]